MCFYLPLVLAEASWLLLVAAGCWLLLLLLLVAAGIWRRAGPSCGWHRRWRAERVHSDPATHTRKNWAHLSIGLETSWRQQNQMNPCAVVNTVVKTHYALSHGSRLHSTSNFTSVSFNACSFASKNSLSSTAARCSPQLVLKIKSFRFQTQNRSPTQSRTKTTVFFFLPYHNLLRTDHVRRAGLNNHLSRNRAELLRGKCV